MSELSERFLIYILFSCLAVFCFSTLRCEERLSNNKFLLGPMLVSVYAYVYGFGYERQNRQSLSLKALSKQRERRRRMK